MSVKNYSTTISCHRTISEIQKTLANKGVRGIYLEYDYASLPVALAFELGGYRYRLPSRPDSVHRLLEKDPRTSRAQRTRLHAFNVSWRTIQDWVDAQLEMVETDIMDMDEIFFSQRLTEDGQTLYNVLRSRSLPLDNGGESS